MHKKKKNKVLFKHPLFVFLISPLIVLLGIPTIMIHLDRIFHLPNYVNMLVGISLGLFALIFLILFPKNLGKAMNAECKNKINKIKENAFSKKPFVLIQKRSVSANYALVIGCMLLYMAWIIFLPINPFNSYEYWIFRIVTLIITTYGVIFSFLTPFKMLIYKNGELTINTKNFSKIIKPSELLKYKLVPSYPKDKNAKSRALFNDVILYLADQEILLKKADANIFLDKILKAIKEIEKKQQL